MVAAFPDPFELKISHIAPLKALLKAEQSRDAVRAEARRLASARAGGGAGLPATAPETIRALTAAARPAKSAPRKSGSEPVVLRDAAGTPLVRVEGADRRGLSLTLFCKGGGARAEAEAALRQLLDRYWPD